MDLIQQAIQINGAVPAYYSNLGNFLWEQGRFDEAADASRKAIQLKPDYPEAHNNLGCVFLEQKCFDEAIASFRKAVQLKPSSAKAQSSLLYTMLFHPGFGREEICEEHCEWNRRHAETLGKDVASHRNKRDPERRLRIGCVAPDFKEHCHGRSYLTSDCRNSPRERRRISCGSPLS